MADPVPLPVLEARSAALTGCPAWRTLQQAAAGIGRARLGTLLDAPDRYPAFSRTAAGLHLDFSRQRLDAAALGCLLDLAGERNLADWIAHLFAGADVNGTEHRPALHVALRSRDTRPLRVGGTDIRELVSRELARSLELAARVAEGRYLGHGGQPVTDVVNIGIGGSDLGLVMVTQALAPFRTGAVRSHFVANIDGTELADLLDRLDPARTLFIVCSKSFTTLETQLNAEAARRWLLRSLPESALARHVVAISVNAAAMDRFGIAAANRFAIWDWVGGRYSLWSSVGLAIAMAIGPVHFRALLDGAAGLDEHFASAPFAGNLPVLLGLLGVWNQNFLGVGSHAVLPYSQRLARLPAFLQQLEMESNGKGVTRSGEPVGWSTGTIVWGEAGSNAQHAFFQLLHQGTQSFSADFVAPAAAAGGPPGQHRAALANMLAQAEALARGRTAATALTELLAGGMPEAEARTLAGHKVHPGDHPSSIILLEQLDPRGLGALVALYEHKVFVQAVIWGINPFDQWGVELGKDLARRMAAGLDDGAGGPGLPGIAARLVAGDVAGGSR
ncbi:MAG: glucose-6-phosphate isomerase [Gammaproteobacteria bacterium]|nr:glucose-6-phosphate isomerase [Gammaproteobacteria bacterium]